MRANLSFCSSSSPLEDSDEEERRLISIMGIASDGRNESIGLILLSLGKYCGGGSSWQLILHRWHLDFWPCCALARDLRDDTQNINGDLYMHNHILCPQAFDKEEEGLDVSAIISYYHICLVA